MGPDLKQYHKGQIQVMGQQMAQTMWATLASFMGFSFLLLLLLLLFLSFFFHTFSLNNNRLYQQQLQEGDRNKRRCDRNVEENGGPNGQLAKER
jgi:uncharacterized membrane protein